SGRRHPRSYGDWSSDVCSSDLNPAATILGAGAGAYAGHEIEKNAKRSSYWSVAIRMDNGRTRNLTYTSQPPVHEGERVRLIDGRSEERRVGKESRSGRRRTAVE